MDFRYYFDFEQSIRSYDFTHQSVQNIKRLTNTKRFHNASAKTIFEYLANQVEFVAFNDYLKRYLYKGSAMTKPFHEVTDEEYQYIITSAFNETRTPHSINPNSVRKWSRILKSWFQSRTVSRDTIFLLGFGLQMAPNDVSEFLVKVLKSEDFDFSDVKELVYWFCYRNNLSYAQARELVEKAKSICAQDYISVPIIHDAHEIKTTEQLFAYLTQGDRDRAANAHQEFAYNTFMQLLEEAKGVTAEIFSAPDSVGYEGNVCNSDDINTSQVEMMLNSGVPLTEDGSFSPVRSSVFFPYVQEYRITRQRIWALEKRRYPVKREDLITLSFFGCSYQMRDCDPADRFRTFVDETNQMLRMSGMLDLYPVNPYESLILLCLLTEQPFETYTDVTEYSYDPLLA